MSCPGRVALQQEMVSPGSGSSRWVFSGAVGKWALKIQMLTMRATSKLCYRALRQVSFVIHPAASSHQCVIKWSGQLITRIPLAGAGEGFLGGPAAVKPPTLVVFMSFFSSTLDFIFFVSSFFVFCLIIGCAVPVMVTHVYYNTMQHKHNSPTITHVFILS